MMAVVPGYTYGFWRVLGPGIRDGQRHRFWRCMCQCGTISHVLATSLQAGLSTRCRHCSQIEASRKAAEARLARTRGELPDLRGRVFVAWHVLHQRYRNKKGKLLWRCRCRCGLERTIPHDDLVTGRTKSCHRCASLISSLISDGDPRNHEIGSYLPTPDEIRRACREIREQLGHVIAPDLG